VSEKFSKEGSQIYSQNLSLIGGEDLIQRLQNPLISNASTPTLHFSHLSPVKPYKPYLSGLRSTSSLVLTPGSSHELAARISKPPMSPIASLETLRSSVSNPLFTPLLFPFTRPSLYGLVDCLLESPNANTTPLLSQNPFFFCSTLVPAKPNLKP
jgi:hypothetical protein